MTIQEELKCKKCLCADRSFSLGIRSGDSIYLSGQLPLDSKTKKIISEDFCEQAMQCLKNIEAILGETGLNKNHILKVTIYLTDMNNLKSMAEVFESFFDRPHPASTVIGVNELPFHAMVCVEAYAEDTRALEVLLASEDCCNDQVCGIGNE